MTLGRATVALIVLCCSCAVLSAVWIWWRLRTIERSLRCTIWDLDALAGALREREEQGQ